MLCRSWNIHSWKATIMSSPALSRLIGLTNSHSIGLTVGFSVFEGQFGCVGPLRFDHHQSYGSSGAPQSFRWAFKDSVPRTPEMFMKSFQYIKTIYPLVLFYRIIDSIMRDIISMNTDCKTRCLARHQSPIWPLLSNQILKRVTAKVKFCNRCWEGLRVIYFHMQHTHFA